MKIEVTSQVVFIIPCVVCSLPFQFENKKCFGNDYNLF